MSVRIVTKQPPATKPTRIKRNLDLANWALDVDGAKLTDFIRCYCVRTGAIIEATVNSVLDDEGRVEEL